MKLGIVLCFAGISMIGCVETPQPVTPSYSDNVAAMPHGSYEIFCTNPDTCMETASYSCGGVAHDQGHSVGEWEAVTNPGFASPTLVQVKNKSLWSMWIHCKTSAE